LLWGHHLAEKILVLRLAQPPIACVGQKQPSAIVSAPGPENVGGDFVVGTV
jgi:hypothetical protein